jgi:hypothetical protein
VDGPFPRVWGNNGEQRHSDHRPVILVLGGRNNVPVRGPITNVFKFEARWIQEEGCAELIEKAWIDSFSVGSQTVKEGLKDVSRILGDWSRNVLGDLERRIKKVNIELQKCMRGSLSNENTQKEHVLRYRLDKLKDQKNTYWK